MILRSKHLFLAVIALATNEYCSAFLPPTSCNTVTKRIDNSLSTSVLLLQNNGEDDMIYDYEEPYENDFPPEVEPIRTIGGGAEMIFEMARQMMLWDETAEDSLAAQQQRQQQQQQKQQQLQQQKSNTNNSSKQVLPRWRPIGGVADANPSFRTTAPMMNSQGYAGTIWRNVRKANKPSLWRHALRTYERMGQNTAVTSAGAATGTTSSGTLPLLSTEDSSGRKKLKVQRTNLHHEGALVACAKLGLWKKAIAIYETVEFEQQKASNYRKVFITDNMVLSLIRSCVRGSRDITGTGTSSSGPQEETRTLEERRAPLDACMEVLLTMEEKHGLPLVARHINPIAAAYQKLGLNQEASNLILAHLQDRTSGPEEEDGDDPFNVNDVRAKDKGSYSLLVKGAVSEGNWEGAVDALRTMTEAGLFPNSRNLNAWTEVSGSKQRAARSWKKKRDEYWLESVR